MKKILLASTFLAGTAGFAVADDANFSFSGAAGFGFVYVNGPDGFSGATDTDTDNDTTFTPTVSAEFTASMMTTTDMGLEATASVTVEGGNVSVEMDPTEDDFGFATPADIFGGGGNTDASVGLSGDWGALTVELDGTNVDYGYSNTWGDFSFSAYYGMNNLAAVYGATPPAGGVAGELIGNDDDEVGAEVGYTFGDYNVYAGVDVDFAPEGEDMDLSYYGGGSATFSGVTVSAEVTFDPNEADSSADADISYEGGIAYATGPYSFDATLYGDNDDTTDFQAAANGSYDLGGGVSVDLGVGYDGGVADIDDTVYAVSLGVSMAF